MCVQESVPSITMAGTRSRTKHLRLSAVQPAADADNEGNGNDHSNHRGECLLFRLPDDIRDVITAQGLTPHDLARLSMTSRTGYTVAHGVTCMQSIVKSKLANGTLSPFLSPHAHTRREKHGKWLPDATSAIITQAWPHLVFGFGLSQGEQIASFPAEEWQVASDVILVVGSDADRDHRRFKQAFANLATRHRVHSLLLNSSRHAPCDPHLWTHESVTFPAPPQLQSVDLSFFGQEHGAPQIFPDLTPFSNVRSISLHGARSLVDVTPLAGCHTLDLSFCTGITDLAPLANVFNLTLDSCHQIKELSSLHKVHTLSLNNCVLVKDVSCLANVKVLSLKNCVKVVDVSMLASVQTLNLSGCYNVVDLSGLFSIHTIDLSDPKHHYGTEQFERMAISDVSPLAGAHTIKLNGCSRVVDVTGLANATCLDLSNCQSIHERAPRLPICTLSI